MSQTARVLKRPYDADEYLSETMGKMCRDKGSITQRIHNSPWFSQRFNEHIQAIENNPASSTSRAIKNLSAAKHRFHSLQDPVSRGILFIEALFSVAMDAIVLRANRTEAGHRILKTTIVWGFLSCVVADIDFQFRLIFSIGFGR